MENELHHHGVKGMKWGVRRYQNKDGSLTPAGKRHNRRQAKADYKAAKRSAQDRYDRSIEKIEKGYKAGQTLSKRDLARQDVAENRFNSDVAKAKATYKQTLADNKRRSIGEVRSDRKQLRKDRKAWDKERASNWKYAQDRASSARSFVKEGVSSVRRGDSVKDAFGAASKASRDAKQYRKSDEYRNAYRENYNRVSESKKLSKRERDKLYRDVNNGDSYTVANLKATGRQFAKNVGKDYAKKYTKQFIKTVVVPAAVSAGAAYVKSRANAPKGLPDGNIIDIKDFTVLD